MSNRCALCNHPNVVHGAANHQRASAATRFTDVSHLGVCRVNHCECSPIDCGGCGKCSDCLSKTSESRQAEKIEEITVIEQRAVAGEITPEEQISLIEEVVALDPVIEEEPV